MFEESPKMEKIKNGTFAGASQIIMKSIEVLLPSVRPLLQQLDVPRPVAQLDLGVEENKQA